MHPLELSPRLRSVAELVSQGARLADVGTDHAYLPVWLLQRGVIPHALACDLREGPLSRARATAERYGLTEQMEFRLCDGLAGVAPVEVDTVVIAGMGGETIAAILAAAPWTREVGVELLLQPMSAQPYLRRWLNEHGYFIVREVLSREGDTLYTAFQARGGTASAYTPAELWAGRQRRGEEMPLREAYLTRLITQTERALEGLGRSSRERDGARLAELRLVHQGLLDMKEEWQTWQQ